MQATTTRPTITVTTDGDGVVSHAGSRLLTDVADRATLTAELAQALTGLRRPRARHDPGRVLVDMAVAVADGATTISDVAVLADQAVLFGLVASDSTCWRLLDQLDATQLGAIARARAAAREVVWAQRAELSGQPFPPARGAARSDRLTFQPDTTSGGSHRQDSTPATLPCSTTTTAEIKINNPRT